MVPEITPKYAFKCLSYTAVFNTVIAIFLTVVNYGSGLFHNFVFSQCIGLSICSCTLLLHHLIRNDRPIFLLFITIGGIASGITVGIMLALLLSGINISIYFAEYGLIRSIFLGLIFGSVIIYFFISRVRLSESETLLQEERIKRLFSEKKFVETELRLLQAQIEPHFLFNTLSNVLSLLDTDPARGKSMLQDLTQYLRMSLSRTREKVTTIGQETEMIRTYINIFKVRMGDRLHYKIDVPDTVKDLSFPPMMIQPLVENAIKHGLEPKIEGGEISIKVDMLEDILRVKITDTGLGFKGECGPGVGLSNIRERLQSLYDDNARLILKENLPSGLKAIIEVPLVTN